MKNIIYYMAGVVFAAMAISSCDEDTASIGQSLTSDDDKLDVVAQVFEVQTRTVVADTAFSNTKEHLGSVFTQSGTCYLGMVRDPQTNADVKSEFATQFHLLDVTNISDAKDFYSKSDDGKPMADSCDLILYTTNQFNADDSLASVKMTVHELKTTLEPGLKYYSDFDPIKLGMVRTDGLNKNKLFSYKNQLDSDSARAASSYLNNIRISLNAPYTDKNGATYNNYGTYIIRQYHEHPEYFNNSYAFSHRVCPGFFFEVTDGYGFHAKVASIGLRLFYKVQGDTAVNNKALTLAGTHEVLQTTLITNNKQAIQQLANETTHTYIKSPAGLFTEVTLPVKEIKENHLDDSLVAAKISFQRLNDNSSNSRMFGIPQTLLMVQEDSLKTFFEGNNVPDSRTSFYANFNYIGSTYSSTNTYNFINISSLISKLWDLRQEGIEGILKKLGKNTFTNKEWEEAATTWEQKHPNWNKVLLVPISYESGSSTSAQHDLSLTSTRLVGGTDNPDQPIKLHIAYAKFKK